MGGRFVISFDNCIEAGLLRKIPPSSAQAKEQFEKAKTLLLEAKQNLRAESPNSAVIMSYAAMLDAAKALLYRDGYREKSHACVVRYLEAKYLQEIGQDAVDLLDQYRDQKHKTMYSGAYYPTLANAKEIFEFAGEFVTKIAKLLEK